MPDSPFSALGSTKPPKPVIYPWLKPLIKPGVALGSDAFSSLSTAGQNAENAFNAGTPRQEQLLGQQSNVLNTLLNRNLNYDPNQFLRDIGNTAFSFIQPNVIDPLARGDVKYNIIDRMAKGLNPAAVRSTADDLRNARIASGRFYDVARNVYNQLPSLYNQAYGSQLASQNQATGYIPQLMADYRNLELSPLIPANLRAQSAGTAADLINKYSGASKAATYGFQQPQNFWDKLGAIDSSLWGRLGEGINMVGSLGGMGGGEGGGGGGVPSGGSAPYYGNAAAYYPTGQF